MKQKTKEKTNEYSVWFTANATVSFSDTVKASSESEAREKVYKRISNHEIDAEEYSVMETPVADHDIPLDEIYAESVNDIIQRIETMKAAERICGARS